eukprot:156648-Chlamydomonas_euryale.AAC.2
MAAPLYHRPSQASRSDTYECVAMYSATLLAPAAAVLQGALPPAQKAQRCLLDSSQAACAPPPSVRSPLRRSAAQINCRAYSHHRHLSAALCAGRQHKSAVVHSILRAPLPLAQSPLYGPQQHRAAVVRAVTHTETHGLSTPAGPHLPRERHQHAVHTCRANTGRPTPAARKAPTHGPHRPRERHQHTVHTGRPTPCRAKGTNTRAVHARRVAAVASAGACPPTHVASAAPTALCN